MKTQKNLAKVFTPLLLGAMLFLAIRPVQAQDESLKTKEVILVHGAWADGSSWSKVIPLLERRGLHVTAVQLPLTSVADDVATVERAIALDPGPVLLVGHSYGGIVITEAGNDPKVSGLVYVSAYAPDEGQSALSLNASVPPAPVATEIRQNAGFLSLTPAGILNDFAQDLPYNEKQTMVVTQGPVAGVAFGTPATAPAWKAKPSWYMIASEDRIIPPQLEAIMAQTIGANTVTVHSSHVIMLSKPEAVVDVIMHASRGRD